MLSLLPARQKQQTSTVNATFSKMQQAYTRHHHTIDLALILAQRHQTWLEQEVAASNIRN